MKLRTHCFAPLLVPFASSVLWLPAALGQIAAPAPASAPVPTAATASSMLAPALAQLRTSLSGLRLDKWKAPGPVREETDANIGSITRDINSTLPSLLTTADAAPGVLSKNLPVFRNVDALYDVLLRVVETADLSAPEHETDTLHQALASLDDARRTLGDAMENTAAGQEQELIRLKTQVQTQAAVEAHPVTPEVVTDGAKKTAAPHKRKVVKPVPQPQG